jgi:hypothetical protein
VAGIESFGNRRIIEFCRCAQYSALTFAVPYCDTLLLILLLLLLLLLLSSSSSSSDFSLLSLRWETFTYPGMCNQQD